MRLIRAYTILRTICGIFFLSTLYFLLSTSTYANNIVVSNAMTGSQNTTDNTLVIQFDIKWDNSWRDSINYDAAWVFVKYSIDSGLNWNHATLKTSGTNPSGFSQGTGTLLDIVVSNDKKGAFLQRTSTGSGTVNTTAIQFVWDYGIDNVSDGDAGHPINTIIKVMAIEMVYVPQVAYWVGGNGDRAFLPTQITGSNVYPPGQVLPTYPTLWPNGFNAFYIMKYEVSQGEYTDFLNTLESAIQAPGRYPNANGLNRHTISKSGSVYVCSVPDRACNYINWIDLCAYADWAGLRPITELEFEKSCRGTLNIVSEEYVWGNANVHNAAYVLNNDGQPTEIINNQPTLTGNMAYGITTGSIGGPLRCGIFAQSGTSRQEAGASYYAAMELAGNLWERVIPINTQNSSGSKFQGSHGNGSLTFDGFATNSDWPGFDGVKVSLTTQDDYGGLGSCYEDDKNDARIADRSYVDNDYPGSRDRSYGGRCARTSPEYGY